MMTARSELYDLLRSVLPSGWTIDTSRRNLDITDHVVVKLVQQKIVRTPATPMANHTVSFVAAVVDFGQDITAEREDALDEQVNTFLFALDGLSGSPVQWTDATRTKFDEAHPNAYDINLSIITEKE